MITIKQIESPAVVTDGVTNVNLYAGQTYTCEVPTPVTYKIYSSFLFDGINENFAIPNADLVGILQGSVNASINFAFKPTLADPLFQLWSNGDLPIRGIYIGYENSSNTILLSYTDSVGGFPKVKYPASAITMGAWNFMTITLNTTTNTSNLYVNGVNIAQTSSTLSGGLSVNSNAIDFHLGGSNVGGYSYFDGYMSQMSIIGKEVSLSEHNDWYNSGEPLDPQSYFGADCKLFFNPDKGGDTAQFNVLDSTNTITATSVNMEDTDHRTTTPYTI